MTQETAHQPGPECRWCGLTHGPCNGKCGVPVVQPAQQSTPEPAPAPEPDAPQEGSLLADIAAIRAAVAEMGGLGWESLDQFQKEMRDDD